MSELQFLLDQRARCERWLAMPADQLPGTLTHDKAVALAIETEVKLVDFEVFDAYGKAQYHA